MKETKDAWVKLHRCLLKKPIWQNQNIFRIFAWCILKAWYRPTEQLIGATKVQLKPGQFVYGRLKASEETGLPQSTVRNCINWLKKNNTLDIDTNNKFSVITVINWELYQSGTNKKDSTMDIFEDNSGTTEGQQKDTNKKDKKGKNLQEDTYDYFKDFWEEYPRGDAVGRARDSFKRLNVNDELMKKIMDGLSRFKRSEQWLRDNGKYIPYAATWLNQKRWEDGT